MSEEADDIRNFGVVPEQTEQESEKSPLPEQPTDDETHEAKNSPADIDSKEASPKELKENPEESNDTSQDSKEKSPEKNRNLEEASIQSDEKPRDYDFSNTTEHILSSPSDLTELVTSFENLQPIYGSEALNFQNNEADDNPTEKDKENKHEKVDSKDKKSDTEDKSKKSSTEDKKDEEWSAKRDRRKSSVLTDADVSRKSSDEPYPIAIPLRRKVNRSTRKKLWREIQRRKPFITENVYAHIHHFAKPPFKTYGCHNCNYRKDVRSYSYEYWNI